MEGVNREEWKIACGAEFPHPRRRGKRSNSEAAVRRRASRARCRVVRESAPFWTNESKRYKKKVRSQAEVQLLHRRYPLLNVERRRAILEILKQDGRVLVAVLARQ